MYLFLILCDFQQYCGQQFLQGSYKTIVIVCSLDCNVTIDIQMSLPCCKTINESRPIIGCGLLENYGIHLSIFFYINHFQSFYSVFVAKRKINDLSVMLYYLIANGSCIKLRVLYLIASILIHNNSKPSAAYEAILTRDQIS